MSSLIVSVLQQAQFLQSWCRWILLLTVGYCLCRLWTVRNCTMLRSGFMASWQMVAPLLSSWCVRMLRCRMARSLWERAMHLSVKSASHSGTSSYYLTLTVAIRIQSERQSAQMSKITNDGLTRSGTGCVIAVSVWQMGVKGLMLPSCSRPHDCY